MEDVSEKEICRFCLERDIEKLGNIFDNFEESRKIPLAVQVMSCVSIEIFEGDGMPKFCCHICRKLMDVMHQYKQICRKADVALKQCMMTGKLPSMFELPLNLVKECLPKETLPEKVDTATNTENNKENISQGVQTESQDVFKVPKPVNVALAKSTKSQKRLRSVIEEVSSKPSEMPKSTPVQSEDVEEIAEEQIEIVELTQSEVEKLQPVFTKITYDIEKPPRERKMKKIETKPLLLNKTKEIDKKSKPLIEFQKFTLNDDGVFEVEIAEELGENTDGSIFACAFCPKTFMIKQQLELHIDTHFKERNFTCEICSNKFLSKNDLAKHFQTHTGQKAHTCAVCHRSFARSGILKRHQLQHKEHLKFTCASCSEKFITENELKKHVDFVHNKPRPFPCSLCDKAFAFKQGLDRHMTVHDPSQNNHVCEICKDTFPTPTKLQQHLLKHAGKRRYPCKYCTKTFILSHHLTRHVRNSHKNKETNKKQKQQKLNITYTCDECEETFQNQDSYIRHTADHTTQSLICPLCKIKFGTVKEVESHIEEHALSLEHFSCETCNYAFLSEELLEKHIEEDHDSVKMEVSGNEEEFVDDSLI